MSTDDEPEPVGLVPEGLAPKAVLGLHVLIASFFLSVATLALLQGVLPTALISFVMGIMLVIAGIAAARLVARR